MATGTGTFMGLAVPLYGEFTITQVTGATDIMTIEGGDGQTGDFIVARTSSGTERFAVAASGALQLRIFTTKPTTGLTKGELILLFHGSSPKLAVCTSTAGDTLKMIRLKTKTLGRLSV